MKHLLVLGSIIIICISFVAVTFNEEPVPIPPSPQRVGNADSGYKYVITGDYIKSGLPYGLYGIAFKKEKVDILKRGGDGADVRYDFNVVRARNNEKIVTPNCLQCHGSYFEGDLILGLGNTAGDFTKETMQMTKGQERMLNTYLALNPKKKEASKEFLKVGRSLEHQLFTDVVGTNPADGLAALLIAHRDPVTLQWNEKASVELPPGVIPSDVPAWWLLKKKNAMFYNGFGRGDFGKFLMGSALLTVTDTNYAKEVDSHMPDVLAWIYSIEAPKYKKPVDEELAKKGKILFENNCSGCHGTYGEKAQYPNFLIPQSLIGTDSILNKSNYQYSDMVDWYNKSWFSKGDYAAKLTPFNGYIAPPLDGVWITAPYLHNGSVPTIEGVLNSKIRPVYWTRNFETPEYDYEKLGWKFQTLTAPGDKYVYNTTKAGYGNYGHYFGDHLTDDERKAVIEYLKTL